MEPVYEYYRGSLNGLLYRVWGETAEVQYQNGHWHEAVSTSEDLRAYPGLYVRLSDPEKTQPMSQSAVHAADVSATQPAEEFHVDTDTQYISLGDPLADELLLIIGVITARSGGRIEVTLDELRTNYHFQCTRTEKGYLFESAQQVP